MQLKLDCLLDSRGDNASKRTSTPCKLCCKPAMGNTHPSMTDSSAKHLPASPPSRSMLFRGNTLRPTIHTAAASNLSESGPATPPPNYNNIDSQPLNKLVYSLFRSKMASSLGRDSQLDGYDAIIDLTRQLNSFPSPVTQQTTRKILNSLFPSWLPPAFSIMFSKPLPTFSCQLNAWATWLTCQWLMGECEVNDVVVDGGSIGKGHGVLVKRCRYLEESGCASICINSCKVPTQEFFEKDMGLMLKMEPNYGDFSCQFSFGASPVDMGVDEAFRTACFKQCPTAREGITCHRIDGRGGEVRQTEQPQRVRD